MQSNRKQFGLAWLFVMIALALLVGIGAISGTLQFIYRNIASFTIVHTLSPWAGSIAVGFAQAISLGIAIHQVLAPSTWLQKLLRVLPFLAFGVALLGIVFTLAGIGTGIFATGWLLTGAALSLIAALILGFSMNFTDSLSRILYLGAGAVTGLTFLGWIAALVIGVLMMRNPVSTGGFSGPGQFPQAGGFGGRPGGFEGGQPGGFLGGRPGGDNNPLSGALRLLTNTQTLRPVLIVSLAIILVCLALGVVFLLRSRGVPAGTAESSGIAPAASSPLREAGRALLAFAGLAVVVFGSFQLVPVSRSNPPVQTTLQWDSQQTKDLAYRACMDCHSNEYYWTQHTSLPQIYT